MGQDRYGNRLLERSSRPLTVDPTAIFIGVRDRRFKSTLWMENLGSRMRDIFCAAIPNGKEVDSLMVGGMDNLIEIAFTLGGTANGHLHLSSNHWVRPRDDGILHAIYGGVYAKDIAPIYKFPWSGPELMPPMTVWGAMSPAGLMTYQSKSSAKSFGKSFLRLVQRP